MNDVLDLHQYLQLKVRSDKMEATLSLTEKWPEDETFPPVDEIKRFLAESKVTTGIDETELKNWCKSEGDHVIVVAKGRQAEPGEDGYLQSEIAAQDKERKDTSTLKALNLKEVLQIPSVSAGEKLAVLVPPTEGRDGVNVYGQTIPAKNGRPYRMRPGKNIETRNGVIYSTIDGQVSFGERIVNVFPLYEVSGDLDLKTGNIDFVGNVIIRGNVPTGFTIKAKGDIKIHGLVEGAQLIAEGSVLVTGGVAGNNRAEITAGVDVHASYINSAKVNAAHCIVVDRSIFHSQCVAGEDIVCLQGHIVGGSISAGKTIQANEIGNRMNTRTDLYLGVNETLLVREKEAESLLVETTDTIEKLAVVARKLIHKGKKSGLTNKEKMLLERQKKTYESMLEQKAVLEETLQTLRKHSVDFSQIYLALSGTMYANVTLHFGKYQKSVKTKHENVKFKLKDKEIRFEPLS
ncbi:FapA family protein [Bacillus tianshenii]|nr:FapA family protein [Bacillus tianshenii]